MAQSVIRRSLMTRGGLRRSLSSDRVLRGPVKLIRPTALLSSFVLGFRDERKSPIGRIEPMSVRTLLGHEANWSHQSSPLDKPRGGMTMPSMSIDVFRVPTSGPGDVSGLLALISSGTLDPSSIVAVLGKTEGNGGVNDFTREYAVAALCAALAPRLGTEPRAVEAKIAFVMSGGTEGVLAPPLTVFARKDGVDASSKISAD